MSDPVEELAELREASDVLLQQGTEARSRLRPVDGQDASGEVQVRLDADGNLEAIQVGFTWAQRLSPEELPAAVLEALTAARVARIEQYGRAVTEVTDEPAPRARPTGGTSPVVTGFQDRLELRDQDPAAAAEMVADLLSDAEAALAEANQILDDHAGRQFTGRSSSRRVTAFTSGSGDLEALDIDRGWLTQAHPANLGRELTQAVRAAGERAQREGISAALRASKLARLAHELTGQTGVR